MFWLRLILDVDVGFKSFHVDIRELLLASFSRKVFSSQHSHQAAKPCIEAILEPWVIDLALTKRIWLISLEPCVAPATNMPIIRITTDNSINENPFKLNILMI